MLRFTPYVLKSLWRHRTRTALTVSGSAVALFVFSFVGAVQEGLDRLASGEGGRTLVVYQARRLCPSTSRLPGDYAAVIADLDGVRDVLPVKVFVNNCRASLDMVVFHGVPPEKLHAARELRLVAGDRSRFESQTDAALVGQAVARRRGLGVGDKFTVGAVSVSVVGIFTSPRPAEENFIYTDLGFLQRTPGLNSVEIVTQFEVYLDDGADPARIAKAIDERFRTGPVATDTRPKGVFQAYAVGDLVELVGFMRYLGFACVGLVLALVATTTVMAVQDRVREHAVLQTLGFSGPRIFGLVLAEGLLLSLAGGAIGVGFAMLALGMSKLSVGTEGVVIAFLPTLSLAATGLAVALAVGLLAALVPAWQAARADIVTALRQV